MGQSTLNISKERMMLTSSKDELEKEADRLMHACQRAEDAGNWSLYERLYAEWERIEVKLMEENK